MNTYFYEVFENIPRQGPGLNSSTRHAFECIKSDLPDEPVILDMGCGKGVQTLELAKISSGTITALDNHQYFLDVLTKEAEQKGYDNRIRTLNADMNKLPFDRKSFDLIWSEGAVFIIGIKEGLKKWRSLLKQGGFLVLSDLVWLSNNRPDNLTRYFEEECMYVLTIEQVLQEASQNGYTCVDHFTLPLEGWTREYIQPQEHVIEKLRKKYTGNSEARETFDSIEKERDIVMKYNEYFGYEFFILKIE
ncbi:2-methoxy-6-polyprenyl-1,4-benzoquinol methylase, mitochondrial [subsurface metagenome]